VKKDPRVKTSDAGFVQMFRMESRLAAMMTESSVTQSEARSAREQLQKLAKQATGPVADAISAFDKKVASLLGGGGGPRGAASPVPTFGSVGGEIGALYGEVDRADAAPTVAQVNALTETEKGLSDVMKQWAALKATDLPALNQHLHGANLPEIHLESGAPKPGDSQDIE
jgi:hypothetical protein